MSALRVKRNWWARRQEAVSDISIFRQLARRWKPVVRAKSTPVPLHFALPTTDVAPPGQRSFAPKTRIVTSADMARSARIWNPWLWVK